MRINFAEQYAVVDNQQIVLTPIENRLLYSLYSNRGHILSPRFLIANVWDAAAKGSVKALCVHVHHLRSKIESNPDRPRYVVTVNGQGYLLPKEQPIKPLM